MESKLRKGGRAFLVLLGLLGVTPPMVAARSATGGGTPETTEPPSPDKPAERPRAMLAPIADYTDDAAYQQAMDEKVRALLDPAGNEPLDDASTQLARVERHLAAVNLMLAYRIEPACSRRLHRLDGGANRDEEQGILRRSREVLDQVGGALDAAPATEGADAERWDTARRHWEILRGFTEGLAAVLVDRPAGEAEAAAFLENARAAASSLSILMEEGDEQVVSAATLWHAVLRGIADDPARAMTVLPLATSTPRRPTLPYAFFQRLLRCRSLSDRGSDDLALALLIEMEDRCADWFAEEEDGKLAQRSVAWAQLGVLDHWSARLNPSPDSTERKWCEFRAAKIFEHRLTEERTVLRVFPAVPIIATPPAAPTPPPAPAEPQVPDAPEPAAPQEVTGEPEEFVPADSDAKPAPADGPAPVPVPTPESDRPDEGPARPDAPPAPGDDRDGEPSVPPDNDLEDD